MKHIQKFQEGFRWDDVPLLAYKEEGSHFKSITRQVVFEGDPKLPSEWRYFEIAADGHSTLERHDHLHVVMIIRGSGQVFVNDSVHAVKCFDVVHVPSMTWHQFRATAGEAFGFLCLVNVERDRPQRPDAQQAAELKGIAGVGEFIRL